MMRKFLLFLLACLVAVAASQHDTQVQEYEHEHHFRSFDVILMKAMGTLIFYNMSESANGVLSDYRAIVIVWLFMSTAFSYFKWFLQHSEIISRLDTVQRRHFEARRSESMIITIMDSMIFSMMFPELDFGVWVFCLAQIFMVIFRLFL